MNADSKKHISGVWIFVIACGLFVLICSVIGLIILSKHTQEISKINNKADDKRNIINVLNMKGLTASRLKNIFGDPIYSKIDNQWLEIQFDSCANFRYIEFYLYNDSVVAMEIPFTKQIRTIETARKIMTLDAIGNPDRTNALCWGWDYNGNFEINIFKSNSGDDTPNYAFILFISLKRWNYLNGIT